MDPRYDLGYTPDWLKEAEAAYDYNIEASKRQDGDPDLPTQAERSARPGDGYRLRIYLERAHYRVLFGAREPIDRPFFCLQGGRL